MSEWLLDTLVATSLLMALVLVIRRPVARHFGPGVAYGLWLIPAARLFMPSLPDFSAALPGNPAVSGTVRDAIVGGLAGDAPVTTIAAVPTTSPLITAQLILALWLGGATLLFLVQMSRYAIARRRIVKNSVRLQMIDGVHLISSDRVQGPLAFGLIRKYVVVPTDFTERFSDSERELALEHEMSHHESRDLYANMVGFVALCLQWFNPLAWASWNAFRFDQEAACDARILVGRGGDARAIYGHTLARAACGGVPAFATALNSPKTIIERLRRLTMKETSQRRALAGKLLLAAIVTISLPITATTKKAKAQEDAPAAAPAEPVIKKKEVRVIRMHKPGEEGMGKFEKRIERNGKTYVFHTDKELSDADVEAMVAKADASVADADAMVADADGKRVEKRVIVRKRGDGGAAWTDEDGEVHVMEDMDVAMMIPEIDIKEIEGGCKMGHPVTTETEGFDGKKKSRVKIVMCGKGQAKIARASALDGMREARSDVAGDPDIPEKTKAEVLLKLDESIAKLEAQTDED